MATWREQVAARIGQTSEWLNKTGVEIPEWGKWSSKWADGSDRSSRACEVAEAVITRKMFNSCDPREVNACDFAVRTIQAADAWARAIAKYRRAVR